MDTYINEKLENFNREISKKRVAIIGLGTSNIPLIDYFHNLGSSVFVFDNREENNIEKDIISKLNEYHIKGYFGEGNLKYLEGFDYIFRSPSCMPTIPELVEAKNKGAIVTTEIEQVLKLSPSTIIGVTGSDGKTTTTTLIYELLKAEGYNCFLGGNIGNPLFTKIKDMRPGDYIVVELSSFQLMNMEVSPKIAVVTNITPNHLNIHKDYQEYIDAKKNIYLYQNEDGILVINKDNDITRDFYKDSKGKVRFFSHKELLDNGIIFDESDKIIKICEDGIRKHIIKQKNMNLKGEHNCENACAAIAATLDIVKEDTIKKTIENFTGVEHRLEFIREINNVKWYNDSIGSSPTRTIAGLNSFDEKIVLIAGGYDKDLDYEPMAKPIADNVSKLILMGATADKIEKAAKEGMAKEEKAIPIYRCNSLQEVVDKAKEVAVKGEVVLFSPASASFDMFKNFADRGNQFKKIVNSI